MKRIHRTLSLVAMACALAACASAPAPAPAEPTWQQKLADRGWSLGPEVETVPNFAFDGFDALDATHVVVHSSVTRRVLVTTGTSCIGLQSALHIGYEGSGHALSRLDLLLVRAPGQLPSRCRVEAINTLSKPQPVGS